LKLQKSKVKVKHVDMKFIMSKTITRFVEIKVENKIGWRGKFKFEITITTLEIKFDNREGKKWIKDWIYKDNLQWEV
jgi:hypothetical protein